MESITAPTLQDLIFSTMQIVVLGGETLGYAFYRNVCLICMSYGTATNGAWVSTEADEDKVNAT